ncbi:E3 ubiquitin-protein ligase TRIM39-like [Pagrus major]|uniref:E3 ubiquitin-protein ligase TRIM39-like n=1 Tax=Pagrus major TaxID=143350 RepID=UPI003CC8E219
MAAANFLPSEDQFLCSICLDVFTDPVTIPCGHNFCKTCITEHWNNNDQYLCPMCKEVFTTRPQLRVNTLFSEVVSQFRQSAQQKASSSSSEQQVSKPGEVPCDVCTGPKLKALKSCLVCLVSYCETHLEPHLTASGLKRHQLIDPVENLEDRMCLKHDKPLELFCKTDQMCVCMLCTVLDHKTHDVVPLKDQYEEKKAELGKTEAEVQQMIQKRRLKIQEIKQSVDLSKEKADREIAEGVQVFTSLKESVERSQAELIKTIEENQRKTEKQAEDFIKELEQEISELTKRSAEVEKLSHSEDHLHLLQSVQSLNIPEPPPTKDWTEVRVHPSYEGTVVRVVAQLEETLSKEMKKLLEAELKRVQQYAVDVTLDPDTAHPALILSDDGKQVRLGDTRKNLPDNPDRFCLNPGVLGKQGFFSGKLYYEVQVKGKTQWDFGVARESTNRKGEVTLSPEDGYWSICLRNGNEYCAAAHTLVSLSLKSRPEKVGVFVDYEEGLVSFHDVDAAALIFSFTGCCFTEKLFPYFCPGLNDADKNSAPLIISSVGDAPSAPLARPMMPRPLAFIPVSLPESMPAQSLPKMKMPKFNFPINDPADNMPTQPLPKFKVPKMKIPKLNFPINDPADNMRPNPQLKIKPPKFNLPIDNPTDNVRLPQFMLSPVEHYQDPVFYPEFEMPTFAKQYKNP